jgi:hypothetical protein
VAVTLGRFPYGTYSEAIMKAILSLAVCCLVVALGDNVDPVGTWKCEYEIGGRKRMSTLMIKKEGDKLRRDDELAGPEGDEPQGRKAEGR